MSKQIAQIIKYEGDNQTFIWKHPIEDFNTGTQLIVDESQEAILYMNGQALDLFGSGRHTLITQNIPVMKKFFNKPTGDETPFHAHIYFINKTEQMAIKWGTDSKVEYIEPTYGFPIKLGASGEMSLRVEDSRKLLLKIVGVEQGITQQSLIQKFRMFLMSTFKPYLAQVMKSSQINIFEVDEKLSEMSKIMHAKLKEDFLNYGVSLENFFVTTILKPEEDRMYQKFKELHFRNYADIAEAKLRQKVGLIDEQTKSQRMIIEAEGISQKRKLEGYTYQEERSFDVSEKFAQNEATGQFANMGIGFGMISGVGNTLGTSVAGIMEGIISDDIISKSKLENKKDKSSTLNCKNCESPLPDNAKFCFECGTKVEKTTEIICPYCKKNTLIGKFCIECGNLLKCIKCGAQIIGGKFCLECGEKLVEVNDNE